MGLMGLSGCLDVGLRGHWCGFKREGGGVSWPKGSLV